MQFIRADRVLDLSCAQKVFTLTQFFVVVDVENVLV